MKKETNKMKEQEKEKKEQTTKRVKLTLADLTTLHNLIAEEIEMAKNKLAIGETMGQINKYFTKKRKDEQKDKEKKDKQEKDKQEIAQKATEKAKKAKELHQKLHNAPTFKDFDTVYLTIENVSHYKSYKGRHWKIYGTREIQNIKYLVTEEFEKVNEKGERLFDMPCYIPLTDVYLDYSRLMITSYERTNKGYNILEMEYEEHEETTK